MTPTSFIVPRTILEETAHALRHDGGERTVVWQLDEPERSERVVRRWISPRQRAVVSDDGHLVHVGSDELARLQFDAADFGLRTWVQLHTHPGPDVRMSGMDVAWAIADFPGALSLIIPVFGARGLAGFPGVSAYERTATGWRGWDRAELVHRMLVR